MRLMNANAWCNECDWKTEGKNAMGNAAKHNQKTKHFVQVELYYRQSFRTPLESEATLLQPSMINMVEFKNTHTEKS